MPRCGPTPVSLSADCCWNEVSRPAPEGPVVAGTKSGPRPVAQSTPAGLCAASSRSARRGGAGAGGRGGAAGLQFRGRGGAELVGRDRADRDLRNAIIVCGSSEGLRHLVRNRTSVCTGGIEGPCAVAAGRGPQRHARPGQACRSVANSGGDRWRRSILRSGLAAVPGTIAGKPWRVCVGGEDLDADFRQHSCRNRQDAPVGLVAGAVSRPAMFCPFAEVPKPADLEHAVQVLLSGDSPATEMWDQKLRLLGK